MHLATLVQEAEQRVSEFQAQAGSEGPGDREGSDRERQLKAWEWRLRLLRRMQTGFEHASKRPRSTLMAVTLRPRVFFFFCCCLFLSDGIPSGPS